MASGNASPRRPTLVDVAAVAGVSVATASRALAGNPVVSTGTRARVWAAVEQLDFRPNRLASSLRKGASLSIGMVVPDVSTTFYAAALRGAQLVAIDAGYQVLVSNSGRSAEGERQSLQRLRSNQVDGLIVATSGGFEPLGVPVVFFDNAPEDCADPTVMLDNTGGIRALVEHLAIAHHHRSIAYLGPPDTVGSGSDARLFGVGRARLEAFRAQLGRLGLALAPEHVLTSDPDCSESVAQRLTAELLATSSPPTALVAGTDSLAVGALRAARAAGVAVPNDLALVSFDEPVYADLIDPPITSLDRHDRELGASAARLLIPLLSPRTDPADAGGDDGPDSGAASAQTLTVLLTLQIRRSCGCR